MVRRRTPAPVPRAAGGRMILWPPLSGCPGLEGRVGRFRGLGPPQGDRIGSPLQKTQNRIYGSQTDPCAGAQGRRGQDDFVATSIRVPGVGREGGSIPRTGASPGRPHRVAPTENPNRIYGSQALPSPAQGDRIGSPLQKTQIGSMVHRRTLAPVPKAAGHGIILWPPLSGCPGLGGGGRQ